MPKELRSPAAGTPAEPTVSVSEALGLPADWTMRDALQGVEGKEKPRTAVEAEEPLPGEGEGLEGEKEGAAAESDDSAEGAEGEAEGEEGGEKPAAAAKPAAKAGEKPAAKPAAKPGKPGEKPAVAAKPAAKPVPGKPGEKPAAKPGEKPALDPEAKIKIGGKEYTQKELEDRLARAEKPPVTLQPEPQKQKTAEEVETERANVEKKDREWIGNLAPRLISPAVTEESFEKILTGGKEGIAEFNRVIREAQATAILMTRKTIYSEIQPIFEDLRSRQEPLLEAQQAAEDEKEWATFAAKYEDLAADRDFVEEATQVILEREGDAVKDLSMEQFQEKVATAVRHFKARFAPKAAAPVEGEAAAAGEGDGGEKPAAPAAKPAAPVKLAAKPVVAPRAKVLPPGSNPPAPTGTGIGKGGKGDSAIINSLW